MAGMNNNQINAYITFFSQIIICYIIIISSIICLICQIPLNKDQTNLFIALCSSAVGYVLPNPSISSYISTQENDETARDNASPRTQIERQTPDHSWRFFGHTFPKSQIVFFSQTIICYIIIIVCIGCLAIGDPSENDYLFTILTASSLGYLLPSPKLKKIEGEDVVLRDAT